MHYVQAIISVGLFGWLGYVIAFNQLPVGEGGSSKTRALMGLVDNFTAVLGPGLTGALCLSVGVVLAFFFLKRGSA